MLIGGLWHGASWNFVLWGALNGLGIVFFKLWQKISPWGDKTKWWNRVWAIFLTFNFISFTRIWFRSGSANSWDNLEDGHNIISEWFTANEMLTQLLYDFRWALIYDVFSVYYKVILVIIFGFIIHFIPEKYKVWYRRKFAQTSVFLQLLICFFVIFIIYQIAATNLQPFIYFQF
jgi:D-alanyl-lipoteichoic acid acyltransferase DltB (MBOAT superfamily)